MSTASLDKTIHQGRNVKRFREMLGMKQEAMAMELGDDWSQKRVSLLEAKEEIEPGILQQVAQVLKVPQEAIKNFDEQAALSVINNTFTSHDNSTINAINYGCTFNPLDKLIEVMDDNRKLYERLLEAEKEKVRLLEKLSER